MFLIDGKLHFEASHAGRRAQKEAAHLLERDLPKSKQISTYCDAMRALLNRYHAAAGAPFGHNRLGPGRASWARSVKLKIDREIEALRKRHAKEAASAEARREAAADDARRQRRAQLESETAANPSQLKERFKTIFEAHRAASEREFEAAKARLDADHQMVVQEAKMARLRADKLQREAEALQREFDEARALIADNDFAL